MTEDSEYPDLLPGVIPDEKVVCHNPVRAMVEHHRQGVNGFRFFIIDATADIVECPCGWERGRLPKHYVKAGVAKGPRGVGVMAPGVGVEGAQARWDGEVIDAPS